MKRYRYPTENDPEAFEAALDYLKTVKGFTGTADEFFYSQDAYSSIPINLDMYFMYRPYLEIMGLQLQLDEEIKRIIGKAADKWYPYHAGYGYYTGVPGSGNNIIQVPAPQIPFDKWGTDEEAIKWFTSFVIEEISNPELESPRSSIKGNAMDHYSIREYLNEHSPEGMKFYYPDSRGYYCVSYDNKEAWVQIPEGSTTEELDGIIRDGLKHFGIAING